MTQDLQRMRAAWQHREHQVEQLHALLQQRCAPDILVHGPPCTGKTGVVRAVAAHRVHAYLQCTRSTKLRQVLASILSQLQGSSSSGKRKRAQGYAAPSGSEATLIADLQAACGAGPAPAGPPAACTTAAGDGGQQRDQKGQRQQEAQQQRQQQQQQQRVVVLDDVQHLLMADDAAARPGDGAPVLRGLLQLREQAGLPLSFVLVSGADAGAGALSCLGQCCSIQVVPFPQYTSRELRDLLLQSAPAGVDQGLYSRFLESLLLSSTTKVSLCLPDLRAAAAQLWSAYVKPLGGQPQQLGPQEDRDAELFAAALPRAAALSRTFEPGASAARAGVLLLQGRGGAVDLELPLMSKFLLVAAFLASRNKPSVDKQIFENSSGARRRGGGRRRGGQQSQDRQAEAAKAAQLKGPHSFTLQRLLHIYRMLRRSDPGSGAGCVDAAAAAGGSSAAATAAAALFGGIGGGSGSGSVGAGGAPAWASHGGDDVSPLDTDGAMLLSSVTGLVGRRLLNGSGGGDDTLGVPRYQCEVPTAVVEQIAIDIKINLAAYLRFV